MKPRNKKLALITGMLAAGILLFTTDEVKATTNENALENKVVTVPDKAMSIKVRANGVKTFDLYLQDVADDVNIHLKERNGNVLYQEKITDAGKFAKRFDMRALPGRNYYLELQEDTKVTVIPLAVAGKKITFGETSVVKLHKPVIRTNGHYVDVSQLSLNKAPLKITIYNSAGKLLYTGSIGGKMNLGKKFDFSKMGPGDFKFSLTCNGRNYVSTVSIGKNTGKPEIIALSKGEPNI